MHTNSHVSAYVYTHTFDLFETPTTREPVRIVPALTYIDGKSIACRMQYTQAAEQQHCAAIVLCCVVLVDTLIILYNERCAAVCESQILNIHTDIHTKHVRLRYTFESSTHNESVIRKQSIGNDIYVRRSWCCCSITVRGVISHWKFQNNSNTLENRGKNEPNKTKQKTIRKKQISKNKWFWKKN